MESSQETHFLLIFFSFLYSSYSALENRKTRTLDGSTSKQIYKDDLQPYPKTIRSR